MTKPKEVVEVEPINPVVPNPRDLELPDPLEREVNMDQHRLDERARELIKRGEYNHMFEQLNANHRIGQGNENRDRYDRHYDRNERGLRLQGPSSITARNSVEGLFLLLFNLC